MTNTSISALIGARMTTTPDFPEPGILFRDLTAVMADGPTLSAVTDALLEAIPSDVDAVVCVEARGFLFASAAALRRGVGVFAIRKAGKLPGAVLSETYDLEYGTATIELLPSALAPGSRVYLLDDVLATPPRSNRRYPHPFGRCARIRRGAHLPNGRANDSGGSARGVSRR